MKVGEYYVCTNEKTGIMYSDVWYVPCDAKFTRGKIYKCGIYAECLFDDGYNIVHIQNEAVNCFKKVGFTIDDSVKELIDKFQSKGVSVVLEPKGIRFSDGEEPIIDYYGAYVSPLQDGEYMKFPFFSYGYGVGLNQREAIIYAMKYLVRNSPGIRRLKRALSGYDRIRENDTTNREIP